MFSLRFVIVRKTQNMYILDIKLSKQRKKTYRMEGGGVLMGVTERRLVKVYLDIQQC